MVVSDSIRWHIWQYYFQPTIFTNASNEMRIAQEEIFGPVLTVIPFDTEAEAIRIANGTNYGLALECIPATLRKPREWENAGRNLLDQLHNIYDVSVPFEATKHLVSRRVWYVMENYTPFGGYSIWFRARCKEVMENYTHTHLDRFELGCKELRKICSSRLNCSLSTLRVRIDLKVCR